MQFFPDINLLNYGEKLKFIVLHPFHIWWNEKTPVAMGIAIILWLMGVSYFLTYYRNYLKQKGIVVKSLNLKNPLESDRYNPFLYTCFYRRGETFAYFVRNKDIIFIKYVKCQ